MDGVVLHEMSDDLILRLRPDARTALVVLTRDPNLDDFALVAALQSNAFYIGVIGPRPNGASRRARISLHAASDHQTLTISN